MATKELKQVWNSAVTVAIAVVILKQRQRKFNVGYLQNCDLQFPNLTYAHPRLLFTLIFSYKRSTHHKREGVVTQGEKPQWNKRKTRFKREIKGCTREEIVKINWEFNPSYSSLIFVFSIYSRGCVSWPKPCSLFFFCKSWTKFICSCVINNLDDLLTGNISCCSILFW